MRFGFVALGKVAVGWFGRPSLFTMRLSPVTVTFTFASKWCAGARSCARAVERQRARPIRPAADRKSWVVHLITRCSSLLGTCGLWLEKGCHERRTSPPFGSPLHQKRPVGLHKRKI